MALDNYRDLSSAVGDLNPGFQFEFACAHCSRRWKSAFKPYRMGMVTNLLARFAYLMPALRDAGRSTGAFSDVGSRSAQQEALAEASQQAERMFHVCHSCRETVCDDCFDTGQDTCTACLAKAGKEAGEQRRAAADEARETSAHACPNCSTPHAGGRFCAECGFDMASTHKSCPGCGVMLGRNARFCTDCGHGF